MVYPMEITRNPKTLGIGFCLHYLLWVGRFACLLSVTAPAAVPTSPPDYAAVDAIFNQHCLDCHAAQDPEHGLVLDTFKSLMQGGETGPAIVPGKSHESLLIQMVEGRFEKNGKPKIMPPGKRKKLTSEEIAVIKAWIDSGAEAPSAPLVAKELAFPKIVPKTTPRNPVNGLAYSSQAKIVAAARYAQVELRDASDLRVTRTLDIVKGNVNAVTFSPDGTSVFAAGGQPAVAGEVRQWSLADGELIRIFAGHKDAIYALALSPDGKTLATGSYDQKINLWDIASAKEIKTLSGHNGCVYHLAFRPDGKILASASADRTVKLWDVSSGERRETLSQSLKEVYAVTFSPDGKHLFAGGADNRIRVWEISETAAETTNPILHSKFAHDGAILNLAISPDGNTLISAADDRTVRLWDPLQMKEQFLLAKQPDWPPGLALGEGGKVFVGRLDGTIGTYDAKTGEPIASTASAHELLEVGRVR
jgi:mono/diheme cytochrome c family protein